MAVPILPGAAPNINVSARVPKIEYKGLKRRCAAIRQACLRHPLVSADVRNDLPATLLKHNGVKLGRYLLAVMTAERKLGRSIEFRLTLTTNGRLTLPRDMGTMHDAALLFWKEEELERVEPFDFFHRPKYGGVHMLTDFIPAPWEEELLALQLGKETVAGEHLEELLH